MKQVKERLDSGIALSLKTLVWFRQLLVRVDVTKAIILRSDDKWYPMARGYAGLWGHIKKQEKKQETFSPKGHTNDLSLRVLSWEQFRHSSSANWGLVR